MTVFFDIGSTLIEGPPSGPGKRLAAALGVDDEAAVARLLFQTHLRDPDHAASEFSGAFGVDRSRACAEIGKLWLAQRDEAYVLPGAVEAVGRLRGKGIRRGYISNIWPPFYERFALSFPEEAPAPQFLSFRTGRMKPDAAFYRDALEATGEMAEDCVMVGDTYLNDIAPAMQLGMRAIWVLHRPDKEKRELARVLNGELPAPYRTLCSIEELHPELL